MEKQTKDCTEIIDHTDFTLDFFRISLFISDVNLSGKSVLRRLPENWFALFDADPVLVPLPDGAPPNFPIAELKNSKSTLRFGISRVRLDFEVSALDINKPIPSLIEIPQLALKHIIEFVEIFDLQIIRLAANIIRITKHPDPGLFLAKHFCQDKWWENQPLNRPSAFEVHSHKRYLFNDDIVVNSWVRNKSGFSKKTVEPLIVVEQDINTLLEEISTRRFDTNAINSFYTKCVMDLDEIHALYYPAIGRD